MTMTLAEHSFPKPGAKAWYLLIAENTFRQYNADGERHIYMYTRSRITRTRLYRIITYFEGHLPHQKSLH